MTPNTEAFDEWIRSHFVEMNTLLEEAYFSLDQRTAIAAVEPATKTRLLEEGSEFVSTLLGEGNTDEGFDSAYDLLGNVGLYMSACHRHEIDAANTAAPDAIKNANALALQLGASVGLTPRFSTAHLTTHNRAVDGAYKSFTSLHDEQIFLEFNCRGIFSYKRAADALVRILPLGVSHAVTHDLLKVAKDALQDVVSFNDQLFEQLDADRFFYNVRPYYKTYRVGRFDYRGSNGGDFSGINEIDLLLGLCRAEDPSYSQLLVDKFLYIRPEEQARLRDAMRRRSLLQHFLDAIDGHSNDKWFQRNAALFLEVCEMHGAAAAQHHDQLVNRFIQQPSESLSQQDFDLVTASGPPLEVVIRALEKLRDLRMAADRDDIPSAYGDLQRIRAGIG